MSPMIFNDKFIKLQFDFIYDIFYGITFIPIHIKIAKIIWVAF